MKFPKIRSLLIVFIALQQGILAQAQAITPENALQSGILPQAQAVTPEKAFTEEEIVFTSPYSGLKIAGTLAIPAGTPKAAVSLATGSGSQDRDETLYGKKPFKHLSDSLAARGFIVLRTDDRAIGGSEAGDIMKVTTFDFATDAQACIDTLSRRFPAVPHGIIGHSEGGLIAIINAAKAISGLDFIITLGASAFPGDSIILSQVESQLLQAGAPDLFKKQYPSLRKRYDYLKTDMPAMVLEPILMADLVAEQPMVAQMPKVKAKASKEINMMLLPWYRTFLCYDPAADIQKVAIPWLALNGSLDTQVAPANLEKIGSLNQAAKCVLMPGLNHLFIKAKTGATSEYPTLPGDIDPSVALTINKWFDSSFRR